MVRTLFSRELEKLQDDVLVLGSMVRQSILESVDALRARDHDAARRIIAGDRQINARKYTLEQICLTLIATQQPMARDLRFLAAVLDISTELERMGDYAKGISRINLYLGHEPLVKPLIDIPRMADKAMDMLQRSLFSLVMLYVE
jgi:phosphate transport system protein